MARYATVDDVKLALRAPASGAASWEDDTYTDLLDMCLVTAETIVDDMCPGWAPFSATPIAETRDIQADGAAVYGVLSTPPFTVAPTTIVAIDSPDDTEADEEETNIRYEPELAIMPMRPGKNIKRIPILTPRPLGGYYGYQWIREGQERFVSGQVYRLKGATWGWPGIPSEVKLAATHIAARNFMAMREPMGIMETAGGTMYMPTKDPAVRQWLNPYLVGGIV